MKRGRQEQVTCDNQDVEVWLSSFTYEVACSALSHLYHDSGKNKEEKSPLICSKLLSYKKGSRIIVKLGETRYTIIFNRREEGALVSSIQTYFRKYLSKQEDSTHC